MLVRTCTVAVVLATVVVVFGAVTLVQSRSSLRYRQRVLVPASTSAQTLYRQLLNEETGARGYTITGDPSFLEPYDEGRNAQALLRTDLHRLLDDKADLSFALTVIEEDAGTWSAVIAEQIDLVRSGRQAEAIALVKTGRATAMFDDVRSRLEDLIAELNRRRLVSAAEVDRRVNWLGGVAIGGAVLAVGGSLAVWQVVGSSVRRPLDRLRRETSSVAGGQLDTPITPGGPTEIDELGRSIENMRVMLIDEIQSAFSNGVIDAEVAERTRLANDLHDDPIQRLTALQWKLDAALIGDDATVRAATVAAVEGLTDVQLRLRNLMFQLHPPSIDTDGLDAALDELLGETFEGLDIDYHLDCDDTTAIPTATLSIAYRFIAEALRNIRKHADAHSVIVEVHVNDGLAVAVVDDGVGFDPSDPRAGDHRGLEIGPQLAHALGGWWRIHSRRRPDGGDLGDDTGTTVTFWLPLAAAHQVTSDGDAARPPV